MTDAPSAIEPIPDRESPAPAAEPSSAPWIVLIVGVALLLTLFIALALLATPPAGSPLP